jgi:hypothetical protein
MTKPADNNRHLFLVLLVSSWLSSQQSAADISSNMEVSQVGKEVSESRLAILRQSVDECPGLGS